MTAPTSRDELRNLLQRAQSGDVSTRPILREWLQDAVLVNAFGNLAAQAERAFVRAAAGKDLAAVEGLTRKLELLREELGGPNPSPLERLLVERIAACWLETQLADLCFAQGQESCTLAQGEYRQRRMDRAQKRYLSAIKALATIRKLAVPSIRVHVAMEQVNVAGACPGE